MKQLFGLLKWTLKAAIFFTLFAFALNNQHDVTVQFFFGYHWHGPLVLAVLSAFAMGVGVGVVGMVPRWWRHRQVAPTHTPSEGVTPSQTPPATAPAQQPPYGI